MASYGLDSRFALYWIMAQGKSTEVFLGNLHKFSAFCMTRTQLVRRQSSTLNNRRRNGQQEKDQVKRLAINVPLSSWGVWVLSHIDLKHTARVRCCREFLVEKLQLQKQLFTGESSIYAN